jgi:hypothetical protein
VLPSPLVNHVRGGSAECQITIRGPAIGRGRRHLPGPEKENPAVGAPGYIVVVIGVYGFNYAAWLRAISPSLSFLFERFSLSIYCFRSPNVFFLFCFFF